MSSIVPLRRYKFLMSTSGKDAPRASRQVKSRRQRHWVAEMGRDWKKELITLLLESHQSHSE